MVDRNNPTEKRLWHMAKASAGASTGLSAGPASPTGSSCPDAMGLSSWLDGRASQREADQIELHLASCPACVDAAGELRALLAQDAQPIAAAPQTVLDHAKALVVDPGQARLRPRATTVPAVLAWPQWAIGAARWAAAAMVLLAITYGGFRGGLQTSTYLAQQSAARAQENVAGVKETPAALRAKETAALANDGPFGLGQADATDQDELIAMAEAD